MARMSFRLLVISTLITCCITRSITVSGWFDDEVDDSLVWFDSDYPTDTEFEGVHVRDFGSGYADAQFYQNIQFNMENVNDPGSA